MTIYLLGEPTQDWSYDYSPYLNYHYPQYYQRHLYPTSTHLAQFAPLSDLDLFSPTAWSKRYQTLPKCRRSADVSKCPRKSEPIRVHPRFGLNPEAIANVAAHVNANASPQNQGQVLERAASRPNLVDNGLSGDSSVIQYVPRHFEVDCSEFRPENVLVRVIDNQLVVQAQQEQQTESGFVRMELRRQFELGDRFDLSNIKCLYTSQGRLCIEVPCATAPEPAVRQIPVVTETAPVQPESSTDLSATSTDAQPTQASASVESVNETMEETAKPAPVELVGQDQVSNTIEDQTQLSNESVQQNSAEHISA